MSQLPGRRGQRERSTLLLRATFPNLTAELLRRGYSDDDVKKVLGLNVLRAMRGAEDVAKRLQKQRQASPALIDQLDKK